MLTTKYYFFLMLMVTTRVQQTHQQQPQNTTTPQPTVTTSLPPTTPSSKPHIILIIADELGWNDVSFHGADQIPTPNLDALAYNGIILNNYYTQSSCTPSRSALMTGRYPIHLGMQGLPLSSAERRALPPGKILPEYLKDMGYETRIVGKWHLGFYKKQFTPTFRGFDSHLGYWTGFTSYYDHMSDSEKHHQMTGYDFRRNMDVAWDLAGKYATDVFTNESVRIIQEHNSSTPLFLYLCHLAVHAGNEGKLLEAPQEEIEKFSYISDPNRRTYAAMVSKMDESVGSVVEALKAKGMLNNSVVVFISDNGAPSVGDYRNWGSNFPLRGNKKTLWEGGVRVVGLTWSPLFKSSPRVSNQLMHVSDWLPTLYSAAGGVASNLPENLDGFDQWNSLVNDEKSPRTEVLINIDEKDKTAAYRFGEWKLVIGFFGDHGELDGYYGESGQDVFNPPYNVSLLFNSAAWKSISDENDTDVSHLREMAKVSCDNKGGYERSSDCNPYETKTPCLFNLHEDPCETTNLVTSYPQILSTIYRLLQDQRSTLVPQHYFDFDFEGANPLKFNNTWTPWMV
ncbi:arylsulfatase B-like [Periplaneta americana]|uniref:arylsulfatase B-like n=1 Tax=Periplaneta americana TaxID=6978 RepID=UPI0037E7D70A